MKKILIVMALVVALAVPFTAFAATSDAPLAQTFRNFCGIDTSKLTDEQKSDLNDQFEKMMDLRKQSVQTMVDNGTITKEQGDAVIKNFEEMAKYRQENGIVGGFGGHGKGMGMGRGFGGNGCTFNVAPTPTT